MSKVFVLDTYQKPLNPVHPGRARFLLTQGKAAVFRRYPFTIILKDEIERPQVKPLRIKIDPGSKTTGIAIVNDQSGEVVFAAELSHRGQVIKKAIDGRRAIRRLRRQRKTRYRQSRRQNRKNREKGWLSPSLESRISNILTWVNRLSWLCPIAVISMELVKFDMQKMENPEISGVEYQQGTLAGYEVREYLLEKWNRQCAYCGGKDIPLQIEHIHPRAKGGTDRIANLTLACKECNQKKGIQDITVFLAKKPDVLKKILTQTKTPLRDAAAVNTTQWALFRRLKATGFPVECGSGGLTKFNRTVRDLPKTHWLDAACVGVSTPEHLTIKQVVPLIIKANGHGTRQMATTNRYGLPIRHRKNKKIYYDCKTGNIVRAVVPSGKKRGTYIGRVQVRSMGTFDITTNQGRIQHISHRFCEVLHQSDGYSYKTQVNDK